LVELSIDRERNWNYENIYTDDILIERPVSTSILYRPIYNACWEWDVRILRSRIYVIADGVVFLM
jgi:hypothetical protein